MEEIDLFILKEKEKLITNHVMELERTEEKYKGELKRLQAYLGNSCFILYVYY